MKKNTIMICGNFNVIHSGHLRILEFAKKIKKKLIVGVYADKLTKGSIINEQLRLKGVKSVKIVNEVFIIKDGLKKFILKHKPEVLIKGKEYENLFNVEKKILESYGGKLIFSSGESGISSKDFINNELKENIFINYQIPKKFVVNHNIKKDNLIKIIQKFSSIKALVIGDTIIDKYIFLDALSMSREDNTIVTKKINDKRFIGGAAISAAHCSSLGAKTTFLSLAEKGLNKNYVVNNLKKYKVNYQFLDDHLNKRIVVKEKFRISDKTMLRINYFNNIILNKNLKDKINILLKKLIKQNDVILISDFNYGLLSPDIALNIINEAKKNKKKIFVDCQSSSQFGNLKKYKDIELITPTEYEARENLRDYDSGLVVVAKKIQNMINAKCVLITLGKEGMIIQNKKEDKEDFETDKINSLNISAKDISGAGDSLFISSSLALASGASIWEASLIGSLVAAIQVNRIGNTPIKKKELYNLLNTIVK